MMKPFRARHPFAKANWRAVDWSLTNAEIARQQGVSEPRVRERRLALQRNPDMDAGPEPQAIKRAHNAKQLEAVVAAHADIPLTHLARSLGRSYSTLRNARDRAGLPPCQWYQTYPWARFNWDLPNTDLGEVWGVCANYVSNRRRKLKQGESRWSRRSRNLTRDPAYRAAIKAERKKVVAFRREMERLGRSAA